jgi:uncharacterized MAPEG superfamily protein
MPNITAHYNATLGALLAVGGMVLLQLIIADFAAIRAGHKAGTPIPADFSRFYCRAARAHANTNESVAAFLVLAVAGLFLSASAVWLNALCWAYVGCRMGHMLAYYFNKKLARSTAFGLSLVALLGLLIVGTMALGARLG